MSVFDRTTTTSEGNFELVELDTTGEEGEFDHTVQVNPNDSLVSVLIEGEIEAYEVLLDDEYISDEEETDALVVVGERRTLITVPNPAPTGRVRLLIRGILNAGRRAKISVLKFARRLRGHISCNACKRLFRFIVFALLSVAGAPDVQVGGMIPTGEFGEWIAEAKLPPAVQRILEYLDGEPWRQGLEALRRIGDALSEVLTPVDAVVTHLCERMGLCGETA
jgi:hypothetical protein